MAPARQPLYARQPRHGTGAGKVSGEADPISRYFENVTAAVAEEQGTIESPRMRACHSRASTPALLKGLLFGPSGRAMSPAHTRRGGKLYRYYVCQAALKGEISDAAIRRVSAATIEAAVIEQLESVAQVAGDCHGHVARGERTRCRTAGGDGTRSAGAPRPNVGRAVPRRASPHHTAVGPESRPQA